METLFCLAFSNKILPRVAIRSLLAVITDLLDSRHLETYLKAGSNPPIISITTDIFLLLNISSGLVVIISCFNWTFLSLLRSVTSIFEILIFWFVMSSISDNWCCRISTNSLPMFPIPSTAISVISSINLPYLARHLILAI